MVTVDSQASRPRDPLAAGPDWIWIAAYAIAGSAPAWLCDLVWSPRTGCIVVVASACVAIAAHFVRRRPGAAADHRLSVLCEGGFRPVGLAVQLMRLACPGNQLGRAGFPDQRGFGRLDRGRPRRPGSLVACAPTTPNLVRALPEDCAQRGGDRGAAVRDDVLSPDWAARA